MQREGDILFIRFDSIEGKNAYHCRLSNTQRWAYVRSGTLFQNTSVTKWNRIPSKSIITDNNFLEKKTDGYVKTAEDESNSELGETKTD